MTRFNQMTQQELEALSDLCHCDTPCDAYGGCDQVEIVWILETSEGEELAVLEDDRWAEVK